MEYAPQPRNTRLRFSTIQCSGRCAYLRAVQWRILARIEAIACGSAISADTSDRATSTTPSRDGESRGSQSPLPLWRGPRSWSCRDAAAARAWPGRWRPARGPGWPARGPRRGRRGRRRNAPALPVAAPCAPMPHPGRAARCCIQCESGEPCGVPASVADTMPPSKIPARSQPRSSLSTRRSRHAPLDLSDQRRVRDLIKAALDVGVERPQLAAVDGRPDRLQRVMPDRPGRNP